MTPDEWAAEARERVKYCLTDKDFDVCITQIIREAESAAYERAALVADTHQDHAMGMPQHAVALAIADRIRALKEQTP